jgi:hypothetical protein
MLMDIYHGGHYKQYMDYQTCRRYYGDYGDYGYGGYYGNYGGNRNVHRHHAKTSTRREVAVWGGGRCWPAGARPPSLPRSTSSRSSSSQTSGCGGRRHEEQKGDEKVVVEALGNPMAQDEIVHGPTISEELKGDAKVVSEAEGDEQVVMEVKGIISDMFDKLDAKLREVGGGGAEGDQGHEGQGGHEGPEGEDDDMGEEAMKAMKVVKSAAEGELKAMKSVLGRRREKDLRRGVEGRQERPGEGQRLSRLR